MAGIELTTAQRKLLLHHRLYPQDAAFNIQIAYRLRGSVDLDRLRGVLQRAFAASVALNTTFEPSGERDVAVRNPGGVPVTVTDAPQAPDAEAEAAAVARLAGEIADTPLPPQQWPLYRCRLVRGRFASYLDVTCSHLVADAYAMFNLGRLISRVYADPDRLDAEAQLLADDPAELVTPGDPTRAVAELRPWFRGVDSLTHRALAVPRGPGGALPGRQEQRWLAPDLAAALKASDLARPSPFPVFVAAHAVVLAALTGSPQVVVGVPLAGRRGRRQRASLGYFVNTLPLPLDLAACASFAELCATVARRVATMLRHQDLDLTAHAGQVFEGRPPAPIAVDNAATFYHDRAPLTFDGCQAEPMPVPRRLVRYPLGVHIQAADDRWLMGVDAADQLAPSRPLDCLEQVLRVGLADPATPPLRIPVVDRATDEAIDRLVNAREAVPVAASLDAALAAAVAAHGERTAVSDETGAWSYRQLDAAVSQVAAAVRAAGGRGYVAVAARPRRELVAVLLGVVRAGRAYVPLDPRAPGERVRHIVSQFDDLTLIADPELLPDAPVSRRITLEEALGTEPDGAPCRATPDDPAYVIFTSGSTGVPKGVEVTHRNVLRLLGSAQRHYGFNAGDVWCLFHSYAFDVSVWEIFGSLLHGGRLVVPPERAVRSPDQFARLLADERVTVLNQTPSAFRRLTGVLTAELAERLAVRTVVFAGEALHFDTLRPWLELVGPRARLVNMYGITETTVHTTYFEVEPGSVGVERASVIGRPLADLSLAVVDRQLNRCPVGVPGELLVAGPGVANGYLGQPELTAQRFLRGTRYGAVAYRSGDLVAVRPDGNLVYLDRIDRQIQLRGFRIELGEVESALLAVPGVTGAYVRQHQPAGAEPYLVAWVVAGAGLADTQIRAELARRVPGYMVPAALLRVPDIPLTVNGKVDKAALPTPPECPTLPAAGTGAPGAGDPAGGGDVVAAVRRIWAETIRCGEVGADDNFFDVGGTSMHVAQIHRRLVAELTAADLTMVELFEYPTPRQIATRITAGGPAATAAAGAPRDAAGPGGAAPGRPVVIPTQRRGAMAAAATRRRAAAGDRLRGGEQHEQ